MASYVEWALDNANDKEAKDAKPEKVTRLETPPPEEIPIENILDNVAETPIETPTEELSIQEKLARLTSEDYAYYRSEIWMQMYDEQSEIAEELLDDAQLGKLYRISRHYLKTGEEPNYSEIEDKLLVSQIKSWISAIDLIFDYKVKQKEKSKKGGAPKGNQNARKNRVKVSDGTKQPKTT
jgi:hypothetical protein